MAVVRGQARSCVAVERKVLVKLVHVEGLHVADDVGAELRDVHVAEVDVLPATAGFQQAAALMFQVLLGAVMVVQVRLRSGRGRRWSVRLTCARDGDVSC